MDANKILLQYLYKKIIIEFSRVTGKDLEESMDYFYNSITYDLISNGVGDMHCRGVKYLTDELLLEYGMMVASKLDRWNKAGFGESIEKIEPKQI